MRSGVVSCCLLGAWLVGCQTVPSVATDAAAVEARREENRSELSASALPLEPDLRAAQAVPAQAAPAAQNALAPAQEPGLLSLFTLGAAVVGALATPTGSCRSERCVSASIVDKTAQLEASLAHTRADSSLRSAHH